MLAASSSSPKKEVSCALWWMGMSTHEYGTPAAKTQGKADISPLQTEE
jgi:hypothetical protein